MIISYFVNNKKKTQKTKNIQNRNRKKNVDIYT